MFHKEESLIKYQASPEISCERLSFLLKFEYSVVHVLSHHAIFKQQLKPA